MIHHMLFTPVVKLFLKIKIYYCKRYRNDFSGANDVAQSGLSSSKTND